MVNIPKIVEFWVLSCEDYLIADPDFKCPFKKVCEETQKKLFGKILTSCPSEDG